MTTQQLIAFVYPENKQERAKRRLSKYLLAADPKKVTFKSAAKIAAALNVDMVAFIEQATKQRCRGCGCTQDNCKQCIEKTGQPCHWISDDLCSACVND